MRKRDLFYEIMFTLILGVVLLGILFSPYVREDAIYYVYIISLVGMFLAACIEKRNTYFILIFLSIIIQIFPLFYTRVLFGLTEKDWPLEYIPFFQYGVLGQIAWLTITIILAYIGYVINKYRSLN